MPQFSIIIPLFNKQNFIENTIKSILNQSITDFELIIVNDGSTDNSEEKVLGFNDKRIHYYSKKNEGVSTARNYGIEKAKSDYITFIDADDYWYPNFLEEMFNKINLFPGLKVFSSAIEIETSKTIVKASYSIKKTNDYEIVNYFNSSYKRTVLCSSSAVFHKSVFEKIGLFDIQLKSGEDTDMWIRIGLVYPILFSWKILARYVYDSDSLTKNQDFVYGKINFYKFKELEMNNLEMKKFLDLNRCSLAIRSKINRKNDVFKELYNAINLKNLAVKKRILLLLPAPILIYLVKLQKVLVNTNLSSNEFK